MEKKLVYFSVAILMISLMAVSVTSAGYLDKFITGKATANVNVGVGQTRALTITASAVNATLGPTENSTTSIVGITATVNDEDGNASIGTVSFKVVGYPAKTGTCSISGSPDKYSFTYTCSGASMNYWEAAGSYCINITAADLGPVTTVSREDACFTYGSLNAFAQDRSSLAWTTSAGAINATSSDNPLTMAITGNVGGVAKVTAYDLAGTTYTDIPLPSSEFAVGLSNASSCAGDGLSNTTLTTVTSSDTSPAEGKTETLDFCIPSVPSVSFPAQAYTTFENYSWVVSNAAS